MKKENPTKAFTTCKIGKVMVMVMGQGYGDGGKVKVMMMRGGGERAKEWKDETE